MVACTAAISEEAFDPGQVYQTLTFSNPIRLLKQHTEPKSLVSFLTDSFGRLRWRPCFENDEGQLV
jgi:hypothetical protein